MKSTIPFLLLLFCTYGIAQESFPTENAIWSVMNQKFISQGDSTLNGKQYQQFFISEDSLGANPEYFALFRFDSQTQKAYGIRMNEQDEKLLYDFNVSLNEIITVYPIGFPTIAGDSIRIKVIGIDSVNIDGSWRKRIQLEGVDQQTGYGEFWIEGVGSTFGLFNPGLEGVTVFDLTYPELLCLEVDGLLIYDNPNYDYCFEQNTSGLKEADLAQINVYPNPALGKVRVSGNKTIEKIYLLDFSGKIIDVVFVHADSVELSLRNYSDGLIYFNIMYDDADVVRRKIIYINN